MIDPCSRWYTCERVGPSLETWLDIWESATCDLGGESNGEFAAAPQQQQQVEENNSQCQSSSSSRQRSAKQIVMESCSSSRDFQPVRRSRAIGKNIASSYDFNSLANTRLLHQSQQCYPWIKESRSYENSIDGLDEELLEFYAYIQPTEVERSLRCIIYKSLYDMLKFHFPGSHIDTYGSFKTDLYLPTSDIDIVIFNNIEKNNLSSFKQLLIDSKVCNEDTIIILDKAVVPIIKFRCAHSNIRVDITFKSSNATMASNYIKDAIKIFPAIKVLIVTLKQFLLQRDANEVYYGGISSYALILMTISFLKCIPHTSPNISIGKLLLGFLDFYGNKFDYMSQAISPTSPDGIVDKSSLAEIFWRKSLQPSLLCIQDPLDPTNDVGKSSFGVFKIKSYFSAAYSCLMEAIFMHMTMAKCHTESLHGNTLLGRIILITPEIIQYRKSLYEVYKNFSKFNQALYTDFQDQNDENQADFSNIADAAGVAHNNVIQEATEPNALDSKQATNK